MKNNSVNVKYILITLVSISLTWILHEFSHWVVSTLLGYKTAMTLNSTFPVIGEYRESWQDHVTSAAGSIFTIFEGIIVYLIMKHKHIVELYSTLFACFLCRFGATILSFHYLNDEARISKYLEIGTFTLPIIVTSFLFTLLILTTIKYQFSKKFIFYNFLLTGLTIYTIVSIDNHFHWRLL